MPSNPEQHLSGDLDHPPRQHKSDIRSGSSNNLELISIRVYDLLEPGKLSTLLWGIGAPILHSGLVVHGREYAFGWHSDPSRTGVCWTRPGTLPPNVTFRCELFMGLSLMSLAGVASVIKEINEEYPGPSWNVLTNNCNHFTSELCRRLTGKKPPAWLNRAAFIGISVPSCLVPRQLLSNTDVEVIDGEFVEEHDEHTAILRASSRPVIDDEADFVYQPSSEDSDSDDIFEHRKRRRRRRIYRPAAEANGMWDTRSRQGVAPVSKQAPIAPEDAQTTLHGSED